MNNHHQNARTTFYSRELMVERVLKKGMSAREVAEQFGVSRQTVYKWVGRFEQGGKAALHNRGSHPNRTPRRLPVERVATIAAMRRMRKTSPEIAFALSMPLSTVVFTLIYICIHTRKSLEFITLTFVIDDRQVATDDEWFGHSTKTRNYLPLYIYCNSY